MLDTVQDIYAIVAADPHPFLMVVGLSVLAVYLASAVADAIIWQPPWRAPVRWSPIWRLNARDED